MRGFHVLPGFLVPSLLVLRLLMGSSHVSASDVIIVITLLLFELVVRNCTMMRHVINSHPKLKHCHVNAKYFSSHDS